MSELRRYRNIGSDSARWERFEHRPGDIIISTPPKTGTTLTQRLCALAIFQTADLDRPMDQISPWLDHNSRSDDEVFSILDAQQHRRFIKTHTPLDGIPSWDDVTYLCTARDLRDLFMSWEGQIDNLDPERVRAAIDDGVGLEAVAEFVAPRPETFDERFDAWLDADDLNKFSFVRHIHQIGLAARRSATMANVSLLHFDQLKADTRWSLQAVAAAIGVELTDAQLDELAPLATLDAMRGNAAAYAPNTKGIFSDPKRFFRSGTTKQWEGTLSEEQLDRYRQRCGALAEPDLINWLHAPFEI